MLFTSFILIFTCSRLLRECDAEEVYVLLYKEAKLYADYNIHWNKTVIAKDVNALASLEKTSTNMKLNCACNAGISVKYINETNKVLVTIGNVSLQHNGTVTMTDEFSGYVWKRWHLHVLERPPANPTILESSPAWYGQDYQLNCSGDSIGVSKYKWYKGGQLLTPDLKYNITGNKLTIRNIQTQDNINLTCVLSITDDIQSNCSNLFSVDVWYGPNNITITSEPPGFSVGVNKSITLSCAATCHPPCRFQWFGLVNVSGPTLNVPNVKSKQSGSYTCIATNPKSDTKSKRTTVHLNSGKQVTETSNLTDSYKDTSQDEGGTSELSSGGRSRDRTLIALFYMNLMIIITYPKTI